MEERREKEKKFVLTMASYACERHHMHSDKEHAHMTCDIACASGGTENKIKFLTLIQTISVLVIIILEFNISDNSF